MFPLAYYTPYAEKGTGQGQGFGMTKGRIKKTRISFYAIYKPNKT